MKKAAFLISLVFGTVTQAEMNDRQYILVGELATACPAQFKEKPSIVIPPGFTISPNQALSLAEKTGKLRCNSIFQQQLFMDDSSYYLIKTISGPIGENPNVVVINGRTGEVNQVRDEISKSPMSTR